MSKAIWTPSDDKVAKANATAFIRQVNSDSPVCSSEPLYAHGGIVGDWHGLYQWSVNHPDEFWAAVWRFGGVIADEKPGADPWDYVLTGGDKMQPPGPGGPQWFGGAKLNFAENLLRYADDLEGKTREALVFWNEDGRQRSLTFAELRDAVTRMAAALKAAGVGVGDRVAGYLPNLPETVIAMLAAASLGAAWSSCSMDFGVQGVLDRFGQIEPKVLVCADGYKYAGKEIDCLDRVRQIAESIPSIERIVVVPYRRAQPDLSAIDNATTWDEFCGSATAAPLEFTRLLFDHPLYIMYSSGTTGLPKCMVHGAGGTLLQHLKELMLHSDLKPGDRIFYFTTCGWMMWNWLVSSLAVGATVVLYDGSPFHPAADSLWKMAEEERLTHFGTSAKYIAMLEKHGVKPGADFDLPNLRAIMSTGSPLAPESFDYIYREIKGDLQLASISGGTDIISCFALGCPLASVFRGELQRLGLGMKVEVWNDDGRPIMARPGELVCTRPFPSMPVYFWNDADGAKYRAAYFEYFDGVWRHGDWAEATREGGLIIYGRSDATLNPGGVRIGTAEIYQAVETFPEVLESIVVGQDWEGDVRIVLFVRMAEGHSLTDDLKQRLRQSIRANCSPHHVPKKIIAVPDIPRTISGKITEIAVRKVIHGQEVKNRDALANPDALEFYRDLAELRS